MNPTENPQLYLFLQDGALCYKARVVVSQDCDWLHLEGGAGHQVHWGHLPHAGDDRSVLLEAGGVHGQEAEVCY